MAGRSSGSVDIARKRRWLPENPLPLPASSQQGDDAWDSAGFAVYRSWPRTCKWPWSRASARWCE